MIFYKIFAMRNNLRFVVRYLQISYLGDEIWQIVKKNHIHNMFRKKNIEVKKHFQLS